MRDDCIKCIKNRFRERGKKCHTFECFRAFKHYARNVTFVSMHIKFICIHIARRDRKIITWIRDQTKVLELNS